VTREFHDMSGVSAWTTLHAELARSRRYRRTFALVQVDLVPASTPTRRRRQSRRSRAADLVSNGFRTTDVAWSDGRRLMLLLPECGRREARCLLARMARELGPAVDVPGARIAVFPDDGVTSGALLARVNGDAPPADAVADPRPDGAEGDPEPGVLPSRVFGLSTPAPMAPDEAGVPDPTLPMLDLTTRGETDMAP
jgi:hypothetical protein